MPCGVLLGGARSLIFFCTDTQSKRMNSETIERAGSTVINGYIA